MTLQLSKEINHERMVLHRLYKRSLKTNNVPIKNLCSERTSALVAFLMDYNREAHMVKSCV